MHSRKSVQHTMLGERLERSLFKAFPGVLATPRPGMRRPRSSGLRCPPACSFVTSYRQLMGMDEHLTDSHVLAAQTAGSAGLRRPVSVNLEGTPLPVNTHGVAKNSPKPPFMGRVIEVERLGGRDRERDVVKLVIQTDGVLFHEGQAFGVIPPGWKLNSRGKRVPFGNRLYSIASSRYGDNHDGQTCTLCVVRVVYTDPKTGKKRRGVCSNYLNYMRVGDPVQMTGPCGTVMLLPENHFQRPIVCVATGTGIAPFRSFWRRLFCDQVPGQEQGYQGKFWLLAGFANPDSVLFDDELKAICEANPTTARVDIALSLTQKNKRGEPQYVQDLIEDRAEEFLALLTSSDAVFYFCGLKRMYSGVLDTVKELGAERGIDVEAAIAKLKEEHRWHVETA